jgi:hypothetical protein
MADYVLAYQIMSIFGQEMVSLIPELEDNGREPGALHRPT